MPKNINQTAFDPKEFLAKVGDGKTILEFRKEQIVFAQGDAQTPSSIFRKAGSRLLSYRSKVKRRWWAFWSPASSLAKAA